MRMPAYMENSICSEEKPVVAAENAQARRMAADDIQNAVEQQQLEAHIKQTDRHVKISPHGTSTVPAPKKGNEIQKREKQRDGQGIGHADG